MSGFVRFSEDSVGLSKFIKIRYDSRIHEDSPTFARIVVLATNLDASALLIIETKNFISAEFLSMYDWELSVKKGLCLLKQSAFLC